MDSTIIDLFSVLIVQNSRSIQKIYSELLSDIGLKISDVACLMIIRHNMNGCTATGLRDATCYDKALISRMLADLQNKGFVRRNPEDKEKQRGARFVLTDEGTALTQRIDRLSQLISREIESSLSRDELEKFALIGTQLTDNLKRLSENIDILKGGY